MTKWERMLNENYCQPDPFTGNRPCDDGEYCDKCQSMEAEELYNDCYKK